MLKQIIIRWWTGVEDVKRMEAMRGWRIGPVIMKHHWSASFARRAAGFASREWKWILGFLMTAIGLLIAYLGVSN
ncbi:hypothetical protein [Leisingera sp.]|uniref:hypothetical protein n=1 Tax=Leisingera sp. TaxID=1879318 RepID=UPI002B269397|nr:hypothetical protein [Leisingera sp.]